ncbi:MAG TPA: HAD hydrolase family protein [Mycobacteriales bacterium]
MIRLVATDVDGTLLRSDGTPSPATVSALRQLSVPYVLVTGRPQRWVTQLAADLGCEGAAIVANGALTYDLVTGDVIRALTIPAADARACALAIRASLADTLFAVERLSDPPFASEPGYPSVHPDPQAPLLALDELTSEPVLKLLCRSGSVAEAEHLFDVARTACAGHPVEFTHSSGTIGLLEIAAAGVDKAAALAAYAQRLGIAAEDVLAFGDGFNDVPLIAWAGHGVAVANAHPAVLDVADEVTASNDDDGVAQILTRLSTMTRKLTG